MQEAFVQAVVHWRTVSHYDDPLAWIRRVAINRGYNRRRSRQRQHALAERIAATTPRAPAPTGERDDELGALVAGLPHQQRLALALFHFADPRAWSDVKSGARRVRQRRLGAAVAASAIVVGITGATVAVLGTHERSGRSAHISGAATTSTATSPSTSSSTSVPSATTTTATTSTAPVGAATTPPGVVAPTTTPPVQDAQASDLVGTLTVADTTLVAYQPTTVTLTVRNITDHPVRTNSRLAAWVDRDGASNAFYAVDLNHPSPYTAVDLTLAPGETQTAELRVWPPAETIGPARVSAVLVSWSGRGSLGTTQAMYIAGVPPVAVMVDPPGWVEGRPLDPAQGSWSATMSASVPEVVAESGTVTVNAAVRNTGTQPQTTEGYGKLAILCHAPASRGGYYYWQAEPIDAATIQPGVTRTFSADFSPPATAATGLTCELGISLDGNAADAAPRVGIDSDTVRIAVLDSGSTTSSTSRSGS